MAAIGGATHDQHCVIHRVSCFVSSRGKRLCASSWLPSHSSPKALVLLCHGYSLNCSTYFRESAESLARHGYAVYGLDTEGNGFSEGTRGLTPNLQLLATDYTDYFKTIREGKNGDKPRFLIGESKGGAVVQIILHREPNEWAGAILMAPLFQMPLPLMPSPLGLAWLKLAHQLFPAAAWGPPVDLATYAIEEPSKQEAFRQDPQPYKGCFRLESWMALIQGAEDVQKIAPQIKAPILIVHGGKDVIVGLDSSRALLASLGSEDRTLKEYPEMCHLLTEGGFGKNAQIVLEDMISWLDLHCNVKQ